MSKIILSICIPTYNRADLLNINLSQINKQLDLIPKGIPIEVLIQDNHSNDNTIEVAKYYESLDRRFKLYTNDYNVGAELNFAACFERSNGEYVWILSDDDFIIDNMLSFVINILISKNPDFVYLNNFWFVDNFEKEFNFKNRIKPSFNEFEKFDNFLIRINYWITFVSSGIFKRESLGANFNHKRYVGSNLIHVYWFLTSIIYSKKTLYINDYVIGCQSNNNNIGYNIFETFSINFRNIMFSTFIENELNLSTLYKIDRIMLLNFLPNYILNYRVFKDENYIKASFGILKNQYSKSFVFWVFTFPIMKLPLFISKIYLNLVLLFQRRN